MNEIWQHQFWRGRVWRYAPLLLWIALIFFASSNTGSMSNTSRIIRPLLEFLFPNFTENQLVEIHALIRKTAHFIGYAILGLLASRAFYFSSKVVLQRYWFAISLLLVIAVASLDETNQSFLATRTGSIRDVLLDTAGGATTIAFWFLLFRRKLDQTNF